MQRVTIVLISTFLLTGANADLNLTITKSINNFQMEFFKHLANETHGNIICSGFSLSSALSMLLAGAGAETETQIRNALGYQNLTGSQIHESYHQLLGAVLGGNHSDLNVANSLWLQNGLHVHQSFKDIVQREFHGHEEQVDFHTSAATDRINEWVSNHTRSKIAKLFSTPLDPETRLVLANALYFKGLWDKPFDRQKTVKGVFVTGSGQSLQVDMMRENKFMQYANSSTLKAGILELHYEGYNVSMFIILPRENVSVETVERKLTGDILQRELFRRRFWDVTMSLPRFNVSSSFNLEQTLQKMGIIEAFTDNANFTGITHDLRLKISKVVQKSVIEVNEEGTEAASASGVVAIPTSSIHEVNFTVNRPFLFVISHDASKLILFVGKVANPLA